MPDLFEAFFRAIEAGAQELWLDLSRVSAVDRSGPEALTRLVAFAHELERRTLVVCPPGPVRQALEHAGIDDDVEVYDSVSAAQRGG